MLFDTFEELNREIMRLFQEGAYATLYDLLTAHDGRFDDPENAHFILYLRSCMAARTDRPDLAVRMIEEAFDRGDWYGERVLRNSPSYASLQGLPGFERLVETANAKQAELGRGPWTLVAEPEDGCSTERPCPLVVALHGNNRDGRSALEGWRAVVDEGWLLAAVQSSQVGGRDRYLWDDQALAVRDVAEAFGKLPAQYNIDESRSVIAGFSLGGETALRVALAGAVPVRGFILLGPGGPLMSAPEGWQPLMLGAMARGLRGYILAGEREEAHSIESTRLMVRLLNEAGIACQLEVIPGIAHAYPADFGPYLRRALEFLRM